MTGLKNSKNDELLTMMEEMQDEIEGLRLENGSLQIKLEQGLSKKKGIDSEARQTISDLSSMVSMLKKKVQEQKQKIVELSERNARLNNSDLQLKEAKRLKDQAEEDMHTVSTLAMDAKKRQEELDNRELKISNDESRLEKLRDDLESEIGKRVNVRAFEIEDELEKKYRKKERDLKKECQNTKDQFMGSFIVMTSFTIISTVITAILSDAFKSAAADFFISLWKRIESLAMWQEDFGKHIAKDVFDKQSSETSYDVIVGGVIIIQVLIVLAVIIVTSIFLFINIRDYLLDEITLVVMEVLMAVTVYAAPVLIQMPVNIFTVEAVGIVLYMSVRFFIAWDKTETKTWILFWLLWLPGSVLFVCGLLYLAR